MDISIHLQDRNKCDCRHLNRRKSSRAGLGFGNSTCCYNRVMIPLTLPAGTVAQHQQAFVESLTCSLARRRTAVFTTFDLSPFLLYQALGTGDSTLSAATTCYWYSS